MKKTIESIYIQCLKLAMYENTNYREVAERFTKIVESISLPEHVIKDQDIAYETAESVRKQAL